MPRARIPAALRFWQHVQVTPTCWLWTSSVNHKGYGLFRNDDQRYVPAHQWSFDNLLGGRRPGASVLHRCDVPACVKPTDLFQGTHLDNMRDKVAKGRQYRPTGARHHMTHLVDDDIRHIRSAPREVTGVMLAELYGVSQAAISSIRNRRYWKET